MDKKKELKIELITPERVLLDSTITFATIPSAPVLWGCFRVTMLPFSEIFSGAFFLVRDISGKSLMFLCGADLL